MNDYDEVRTSYFELAKPKMFSYLRIVDPIVYGYVVEADKLLQDTEFVKRLA